MQTGSVSKSIKGSYMPAEITRDIPIEHEKNIFGSFDKYLKKIERALEVDITVRLSMPNVPPLFLTDCFPSANKAGRSPNSRWTISFL